MLTTVKRLFGRSYTPLNKITLSAKNLKANYQFLSKLNPQIKVAPVLKSNAYGHGLVKIAKILEELKPPFFCVDSLYEAYELLKNNIKTPILIMGYVDPKNLSVKKLPFSYAVYDFNLLQEMARFQPQAGIHLFIDTGMHREGITIQDLPKFLACLKKFPGLNLEGLMSHLACLEEDQFRHFQKAQQIMRDFGYQPKWNHLLASSGLLNFEKFSSFKPGNLARVGLALYLKTPVLELTTKLVQIKKITKGEKIGYDLTYSAKKEMKIGILPIGYADGIDRRLSNRGIVLIGGKECPIIGRVSMNITTIDLSKIKSPQIGQTVIVYSRNPRDANSIEKAAGLIKTIPYEILIHLNPTIRREII